MFSFSEYLVEVLCITLWSMINDQELIPILPPICLQPGKAHYSINLMHTARSCHQVFYKHHRWEISDRGEIFEPETFAKPWFIFFLNQTKTWQSKWFDRESLIYIKRGWSWWIISQNLPISEKFTYSAIQNILQVKYNNYFLKVFNW